MTIPLAIQQKHDRCYLELKKFIHEINEGKREYSKSEKKFDSILDKLSDAEIVELPEGGVAYLSCGYKMAQDEEIVHFSIWTAFYRSFIIEMIEECIKEHDAELAMHICQEFEKYILTDSFKADNTRNHSKDMISIGLLGVYIYPKHFCNSVPFDKTAKQILIEVLEYVAQFIDDEDFKEAAVCRLYLIDPSEERYLRYRKFAVKNVAYLFKCKQEESKKKLRRYGYKENQMWHIMCDIVADFYRMKQYELVDQILNQLGIYDLELRIRAEKTITTIRRFR